MHYVCAKLLKQLPESPFSFAKPQLHINQAAPTYVESLGLWQGAIWQVYASQWEEHCCHSQGVDLLNSVFSEYLLYTGVET